MLAPIIVDEHGTPIIIGHSKRLFTSQQVRAMQLRDDGCSFLQCTRPAGWADAHHLIHWADGGATEIDNGALLCNHHHHVVHSRRLAGWVTTDPPDDTLGRPPGSSETGDAEDLARRRDRGEPAAADRPVGPPRVHWDLTPGSYDRLLAARAGGSAA
ncbi:MAG: HNH endonuclease [Actinobacteria bacterium]|nr:HNH endonuclease [Actinomycetota bacterium]